MKFTTKKELPNGYISVSIRLDDECRNGHADFAITGDIVEGIDTRTGCIHEDILKYFPEFADFVALHLCNAHGMPMYPVENSLYWLKQDIAKGAEYMRISQDLAKRLPLEKDAFKCALFELGIVAKWQQEADAAIAHLEQITGKKWVNPYTPEEERILKVTPEELAEYRARAANGYYTPEAIQAREQARQAEKRAKDRARLVKQFDDKIAALNIEKRIRLYLFDALGTDENIIYYDHSNKVVFNWMDASFYKRWTPEEFTNFVESVDKSVFPEGVTFEYK